MPPMSPPYWGPAEVLAAAGIGGTATRAAFSVGALRTSTWEIVGEGAARLHGAILVSAFERVRVTSPIEYESRVAEILARNKAKANPIV